MYCVVCKYLENVKLQLEWKQWKWWDFNWINIEIPN